jgi:hypothetical protein
VEHFACRGGEIKKKEKKKKRKRKVKRRKGKNDCEIDKKEQEKM